MRRESGSTDGSQGSALDAAAATPPRRGSLPSLAPRWGSPGSAVAALDEFASLDVLGGLGSIVLLAADAADAGGSGGGGGAKSGADAALDRELAQLGLHGG